ncbi:MAG: MATE family efflux transporter [Oscillospiraceae bacterium]|nr:MATE family efflux transporter [Oscillospiraceae bacterium]
MRKTLFRRDGAFYRRLWSLTLPIAAQNLITFSLGLIDTFMVSQLGNDAMAAVTTANVPVFLLLSLVFGVQSGLSILASQYWGRRDMESISRAMGVACLVGLSLSAALATVFFLFPVQVMDLLTSEHALSVLGAPYLRIIGFSYVFNMLSSVYVSAQRSVENPRFGMLVFGLSTVLNTLLNYILIFGHFGAPALGIEGAALATLLSRAAEFVICASVAVRSRRLPLHMRAFFHPGGEMLRRFIRYATPVMCNETLWGLGNSLLTVILGYTQNAVAMLAAYSVTGNLGRLFLVVCFGLGAATAVLVGKTIGEGAERREVLELGKELLRFTTLVGVLLAIVSLALVPLLFQPVLFPLFKLYGETARIATALAVTAFATTPFHSYSISTIIGVLRAGGDVRWSTALDVMPQWLVALPLTALTALVWKGDVWILALVIQMETFVKTPLCVWRVGSGKWIHDVTAAPRQDD